MRLDFMFNQKYASQELLYILFFHIVTPDCKIVISTLLTFLKMKIVTSKVLQRFPTTLGIFAFEMTR